MAAVALAAGLTVLLAGCGGQSEQEELSEQLQSSYGWSSERADCVVNQVYERFSAEEIDQLREADDAADLPEELRDQLYVVVAPCASAGS